MNKIATNDQVKNLVQIRKSLKRGKAGNLAENQAFLDFLALQAQMTTEFDKTWAVIKERMEQYDITKISGDFGYITVAERKNYSGTPAPTFFKRVLDTSKINAYVKLNSGKLPKGIKVTTTRFLQKKITLGA